MKEDSEFNLQHCQNKIKANTNRRYSEESDIKWVLETAIKSSYLLTLKST
jgi:hypothetical protein